MYFIICITIFHVFQWISNYSSYILSHVTWFFFLLPFLLSKNRVEDAVGLEHRHIILFSVMLFTHIPRKAIINRSWQNNWFYFTLLIKVNYYSKILLKYFFYLLFSWQVTASVTVASVVVRKDGLGRSVSILCPASCLWRAVWRSVTEPPICPALDEVRGLLFSFCCHGYRSGAIIFSHLSVQNRSLRAFHFS